MKDVKHYSNIKQHQPNLTKTYPADITTLKILKTLLLILLLCVLTNTFKCYTPPQNTNFFTHEFYHAMPAYSTRKT